MRRTFRQCPIIPRNLLSPTDAGVVPLSDRHQLAAQQILRQATIVILRFITEFDSVVIS